MSDAPTQRFTTMQQTLITNVKSRCIVTKMTYNLIACNEVISFKLFVHCYDDQQIRAGLQGSVSLTFPRSLDT